MAGVELADVRKSFGSVPVIHGVDLSVGEGELCVFVGPSGCGKSTLLRMIAGLEDVTGGEVRIGARRVNELAPGARKVAMVFQSYALYPHMSVRGNLGFGLRATGTSRAETERRLRQASSILQLDPYLDRRPSQLSGGQRQRVAIGRAIVREPEVFLFDEPLSNLDAELRVQMRVEIATLHRRLGATMIYVTHDQTEAMTLADTIVVLRAGRIEQAGAPLELYRNPANSFVAGFIGSPRMNLMAGTVEPGGVVRFAGDARVALPGGAALPPGSAVQVGLRPEHLSAGAPDGQGVAVRADAVEKLGGVTYVHGASPAGDRVIVGQPGIVDVPLDRVSRFGFDPADVRLFEAGGARVG